MIDRDYCVTMARYNAWQNKSLWKAASELSHRAVVKDRKAFFGSILGTANHLLWADLTWMSRFDGGEAPEAALKDSTGLHPTMADWWAERFRVDGRILLWAEGLENLSLTGDLKWFSGMLQTVVVRPYGLCVSHFFNHQTHHRGQLHAMLTAAGATGYETDLFIMPDLVHASA